MFWARLGHSIPLPGYEHMLPSVTIRLANPSLLSTTAWHSTTPYKPHLVVNSFLPPPPTGVGPSTHTSHISEQFSVVQSEVLSINRGAKLPTAWLHLVLLSIAYTLPVNNQLQAWV